MAETTVWNKAGGMAVTSLTYLCAAILFVVPIRPIRVDALVPVDVVTREAAH